MNDMVTHEKKVDGSTGVYLNNIIPLISNDMLLRMWGSSLDITQLYKVQNRLKKSHGKLAKKKMY